MKRGAAIAEYVPCEFEVCEISGKVTGITQAPDSPVTAPLCSSANFAMGTDYNDFSSGQSCYGLNPATGAGLWVYFVGAVLALASVPMLLRN